MTNNLLTVKLTRADYFAAERYIAESLRRQNRWYWLLKGICFVALVLIILGFIGLFTYEARGKIGAVPAVRNSGLLILAACALIGVVVYLNGRFIAGILFAPGSRLLQPFTLSVSESGLAVNSISGSARLPWSAVLRIELHGNNLFLFTLPNYAVIIPSHAFASRIEFEAFGDNLGQLRAQHAV